MMLSVEYKIIWEASGNLGKAYRDAIGMSRYEWVGMLDHDAMMMHPNWEHVLSDIAMAHPKAGIITCWASKIGSKVQQAAGGPPNEAPLSEHRAYARGLWKANGYSVTKLNETTKHISGVFALIRKAAFGGAMDGFFGVDWNVKKRIVANGWDALRADGLYIYHLRDRERSWIEGTAVSGDFGPDGKNKH